MILMMPIRISQGIITILCFIIYLVVCVLAASEDYGDTWLYFADENDGSIHVMNFSLPTDSRGFIFGDSYFYLFTRQNIDKPEELLVPKKGEKIESKYFNESYDIKAITHGWLSDSKGDWIQGIKNRFLEISDLNVILVDWSEISDNYVYPWPALCTRYVGKQLSKLLSALDDSYKIDGRNIHLIGHSLGAQVMGYAGRFLKGNVSRITGLDPARPLFELPDVGDNFRLDASDAHFVDIIHSCCGTLGYKYSHGDADFYPNGGSSPQPGCENATLAPYRSDTCSHGRSYDFFSESILPNNKFLAYPCENWKTYENQSCSTGETLMGYPASNLDFGKYYLRTTDEPPYTL